MSFPIRPLPLVKGIASFAVPYMRQTHCAGGTLNARHCYTLFLRHYSYIRPLLQNQKIPSIVAEFGPGSSLGTGLAAILAGATRYIALDVDNYSTPEHNCSVLEDLTRLFRSQLPPPVNGSFSTVFPPPSSPIFPPEFANHLDQTLASDRLRQLRSDLLGGSNNMVHLVAPWQDRLEASIPAGSVDWVISHSVLEHVDDLDGAYAAMSEIVRPGGFCTHLIDFYSHGLTSDWNGHWAVGDAMWQAARGRRPYLLNRLWRTRHLELLRQHGFTVVRQVVERRSDGLIPPQFAARFNTIPDEDARTRMMFVVAQKESDSGNKQDRRRR